MLFGIYSFHQVNVEAYPDPAPPIIEVIAQYPGASAEEVERQVTIPLEITLAGMPGLQYTRSESLFELSHIRNQFNYGVDPLAARQEVINRLQFTQLPAGVTPQISPESPTGEILRYTLRNPKDASGKPIYSLNDLKSLEDYTLERLYRRLPRIIDLVSFGGTVKRYEIHPDPARLRRYGITLQQLKDAVSGAQRQHRRAIHCARRDRAGRPQPGADWPRAGPDGQGVCPARPAQRLGTCCVPRRNSGFGKSGRSC